MRSALVVHVRPAPSASRSQHARWSRPHSLRGALHAHCFLQVRSKEPRTLLALRRHMHSAAHCDPAPIGVDCGQGCRALRVYGRAAALWPRGSFCHRAAHCTLRANRSYADCTSNVDIAPLVRSALVHEEGGAVTHVGRAERQRLRLEALNGAGEAKLRHRWQGSR